MNIEKTKKYIIEWLKKYAETNNKKFVVGVSGGIDSALTSTLCSDTGIKTLIVSMPIKQNKSQLKRARSHAKWLKSRNKNIEFLELNLDNLFDSFKSSIPEQNQNELGLVNSKARLRMTVLYQLASANNSVVVGTGNKIEDFGVGFFTKYGDGGVDISPIADLTKTEVQKIAVDMGIINEIIEAEPTDGLWENELTDEDQLGAKYSELEWAMNYRLKNDKSNHLSEKEKLTLKIYDKHNKNNKHKMIPIPICKIPKKIKP